MKKFVYCILILLVSLSARAQHIYQIRADSVRIYSECDTAELIIENRTRDTAGFLYNKGNGRTEFKKLQLETIGNNQIAITGQDTLDISGLSGGTDDGATIYTANGILTGDRRLSGKERSFGLMLDSLSRFFANSSYIRLYATNPIFNTSYTEFNVQGGDAKLRAGSTGGVQSNVEVHIASSNGVGHFSAGVNGAGISMQSSQSLTPGIRLSGSVHVDYNTVVEPNYTIGNEGYMVAAQTMYNNISIQLPPSKVGRILIIKKVHANNSVTILPHSTEKIENQTSAILTIDGEVLRLIGSGSSWYKI